jgi:hypothetical protein
MIGFNYLLLVAIAYYVLSAVLMPRRPEPQPAPATEEPPGELAPTPTAVPA